MTLDETIKKMDEMKSKKLKDLKERSRPLSELVFQKLFYVGDVISKSFVKKFTPSSEICIGGKSPSYDSGQSHRLELSVYPVFEDVLTRKIVFNGSSIVNRGDLILAKIPLYEIVTDPITYSVDYFVRKFNVPREPKEEELAIEIGIIHPNNYKNKKPIPRRIDRSVEYVFFE